eukprot:15326693-Ditylum_brightwellii.AAC.1
MAIKAPSVEDIHAGFVHRPVDKMFGEPTYKSIKHLQNQLICNAFTLESTLGGGSNSLAGLVEFPQVYLLQTGHHFVRPPNSGEAPTYPPMVTNAQQAAIKTTHKINLKNYKCCQHMNLLLKNDVETCIDTMWFAGIHLDMYGFGNPACMDIIQYLYQMHGQISLDKITTNIQCLNTPADPTKPIA